MSTPGSIITPAQAAALDAAARAASASNPLRGVGYLGTPAAAELPWGRPNDWLVLPELTNSDKRFVGLVAVYQNYDDTNKVALTAQGNYTVDWGDGTVENFSSGATATHSYTYASLPASSASTRGYRQAIVSVTPQAGATFSSFSLNVAPAGFPASPAWAANWLDIAIAGSTLTSLSVASSGPPAAIHPLLERARIYANAVTSMANMFLNCYSLQSVSIPSAPSATDMTSMFSGCVLLRSVVLPDTRAVQNVTTMFQSCLSLQSVTFGDLRALTNATGLFTNCYVLQSVSFPETRLLTTATSMFTGCVSLQSVTLPDTRALTNANSMFSGCYSLKTVSLPDTSSWTVNVTNMFQNCAALQSVSLPKTGALTTMANLFASCGSLQSVYIPNTGAVTSMSGTFSGCVSLKSVSFPDTHSVSDMTSMFQSCYSLVSVSLPDTRALTTATSMFNGCLSLQTVSMPDTRALTGTASMFASCYALQSAPVLNLTNVSSAAAMYTPCPALEQCNMSGMKAAFSVANAKLGQAALEAMFVSLGIPSVARAATISSTVGAGTCPATALTGTSTAGSKTVTMASTTGLTVGMRVVAGTGFAVPTGGAAAVAVTFQASPTNTVTRAGHGLPNDTMVTFATIVTTTGIAVYTPYYVVNTTADTFQLAATPGGAVLPLTGDGSGTMYYESVITAVTPNTSVTLSTPATANTTGTFTFRKLNVLLATFKRWTVTG